MNKNKLLNLIIRYALILSLGLTLDYISPFLTIITTKLVSFFLNLISQATAIENTIIFQDVIVELIPACIAVSAYFLLLILIFSTPEITSRNRVSIIIFSISALLILNTIRIVFLTLINQSIYYELMHMVFWYLLSTAFVVGIWFIIIKIFKIKTIPFYSDFKFLKSLITQKTKHSKRSKKN